MKTVRTTFFKDQENKNVYFDLEEYKSRFAKETTEQNEKLREWHMSLARAINYAYEAGFDDGVDEVLERIAEEAENEKGN